MKYRQRGYQDDDRNRRSPPGGQKPKAEPHDPRLPRDPRVPNMPGFREVFRCTRCGNIESLEVGSLSKCGKCGVALHACIQCESFDPGATFECRQKIAARVSPKDASNDCTLYSPRRTIERETGSSEAAGPTGAKKAFDDLFKL